jgi:hypothetical protein
MKQETTDMTDPPILIDMALLQHYDKDGEPDVHFMVAARSGQLDAKILASIRKLYADPTDLTRRLDFDGDHNSDADLIDWLLNTGNWHVEREYQRTL